MSARNLAVAPTVAPVTKIKAKGQPQQIIPLKVGWFGPEKSGKTTSAALLGLALSVLYHNRAPVVVTDTEPGWQFLKPIFAKEKVTLIQRTVPTFKAMLADIRFAEGEGACVYAVDSLTVIWNEIMNAFKAKNGGDIPINVWGDIRQVWRDYSVAFLNSPMHCMALGRVRDVREDVEVKPGTIRSTTTGTQLNAGGSQSFGYEPHVLIEMSTERKAKKKQGVVHANEGRVIHRADVLGDRSWALNGEVARWSDKVGYRPGGFNDVWAFFKPHYEAMQLTGSIVTIAEGEDSTSMINDSGQSNFYNERARRDVMVAELIATLDLLWTGSTQNAKTMRVKAIERVFGFKTKDALERAPLSIVERGLRIFQAFEKHCKANADILLQEKDEMVLTALDEDIAAYDRGDSLDEDLAF